MFVPIERAVVDALEHRPEIAAAARELEAARIRANVARNELLPVLDLALETYVSGLRGDYAIGRSLADQFRRGEPSYAAGLVFEFPWHNRAAKAKQVRREVELRQLASRFEVAVERLHAEVEIAVREVEISYRQLAARYASMQAADQDVRFLTRRWEELPGDDRAASFVLEDLLDAQDRLAAEEAAFARAQIDYTLSHVRLRRATGTLLKQERVEWIKTRMDGLPTLRFEKPQPPSQSPPMSPRPSHRRPVTPGSLPAARP